MGAFKNLTLGTDPLVPSAIGMETIHDAVAGTASGRVFYGGGYPSFYTPGYYGNRITFADYATGLACIGLVFMVIFGILFIYARISQRYYYGYRKKRSVIADASSDLDILLGGGDGNSQSWRNGRQTLRMLKNGESELNMSARIIDSIEKSSLDYE